MMLEAVKHLLEGAVGVFHPQSTEGDDMDVMVGSGQHGPWNLRLHLHSSMETFSPWLLFLAVAMLGVVSLRGSIYLVSNSSYSRKARRWLYRYLFGDKVKDYYKPQNSKEQRRSSFKFVGLGDIRKLDESGIGHAMTSNFEYVRMRAVEIHRESKVLSESEDDEDVVPILEAIFSRIWFFVHFIFMCVQLALYRKKFMGCLSAPAVDNLRSQGEDVKRSVPRHTLVELLKRVQFAEWAMWPDTTELRRKLRPFGFTSLHSHLNVAKPGRIGGYVAYNHEERIVMLVARGSCSVSDFATNFAAVSVQEHDPDGQLPEMQNFWTHHGFFTAANNFYEEHEDILLSAAANGYRVEIIGYSLGAAVATLLTGFVVSRIPELQEDGRLRGFVFAPPPSLDEESARSLEPYLTSVVWNDDVVPSAGTANYISTCKLSAYLLSKLLEPYKKQGYSLPRMMLALSFKLLGEFLGYGEDLSEKEVETWRKETLDVLRNIQEEKKVDDAKSLYQGGRVIHLWNRTHYGQPTGQVNGCVAHGTTFLQLDFFVPTSTLFVLDHMLKSYEEGIQRLLDQMGEEQRQGLQSLSMDTSVMAELPRRKRPTTKKSPKRKISAPLPAIAQTRKPFEPDLETIRDSRPVIALRMPRRPDLAKDNSQKVSMKKPNIISKRMVSAPSYIVAEMSDEELPSLGSSSSLTSSWAQSTHESTCEMW